MSHFSLAVVTTEEPTEEVLSEALAPFAEFECTGEDNGYVQDMDLMQEAVDQYSTATATLVVQRPDGSKVFAFKDGKYIDELMPYYDNMKRELVLPEGWVELRDEPIGPYETFGQWAAGWYGLEVIDGDAEPDLEGQHKFGWIRTRGGEVVELVQRTNPDKKWDWYSVGGRFRGRLLLKSGVEQKNAGTIETRLGVPEAMRGRDPEADRGVDSARISDIDFATMEQRAREELGHIWDAAEAKYREGPPLDVLGPLTFGQALDVWATTFRHLEEQAKAEGLPVWRYIETQTGDHRDMAERMKAFTHGWVFGYKIPIGITTREAYCETARCFGAYAILLDDQWIENGEMGFWGISSGETMTDAEWDQKVESTIRGLPGDRYVTIVDCHI